jgi:hypothetical protein
MNPPLRTWSLKSHGAPSGRVIGRTLLGCQKFTSSIGETDAR